MRNRPCDCLWTSLMISQYWFMQWRWCIQTSSRKLVQCWPKSMSVQCMCRHKATLRQLHVHNRNSSQQISWIWVLPHHLNMDIESKCDSFCLLNLPVPNGLCLRVGLHKVRYDTDQMADIKTAHARWYMDGFCLFKIWPPIYLCSGYAVYIAPTHSHYNDVTMSVIASEITSLTIVYSTVYSGADQRKHQNQCHWPLCG